MTMNSMGGFSDDDESPGTSSPPVAAQHISTSEKIVVGSLTLLRLLAGFLVIAWMMSLVPTTPDDSVLLPAGVAIGGIAFYAFFFRRQLRGVYKARYPTLRAVEALVFSAAMFLAIFAMVYAIISVGDTAAFSEELDSFSAYYYALTVLATVGFGDIAPATVPARSVTMVQMALDIAFIAVLIRVMTTAARRALMLRAQRAQQASPGEAP